jgi:hypothetical protein
VVLHVAVAAHVLRQSGALELREDHLVGLVEHVGEHVEPPAVRHAEHHLDRVEARRFLDERVEERDQGLAALQRVAPLAGEPHLEEVLQHLRGDQTLENAAPLLGCQVWPVALRLHALLQPGAPGLVRHREVFDAEAPGVGLRQGRHQLPQAAAAAAFERRPVHRAIEILVREAELGQT